MFERLTRKTVTDKWMAPYGPQKITDRLAAYEDSGLTPEEVQELAKAKAEGRLVVLGGGEGGCNADKYDG